MIFGTYIVYESGDDHIFCQRQQQTCVKLAINNSNIVTFEFEVYVLGLQKTKEPSIVPTIRFYHYLILWFCNFMFCCMNVSQTVIKQRSSIKSQKAIFICFRSLMIFSVRGRALCCFGRNDFGRYLYLNLSQRTRYQLFSKGMLRSYRYPLLQRSNFLQLQITSVPS